MFEEHRLGNTHKVLFAPTPFPSPPLARSNSVRGDDRDRQRRSRVRHADFLPTPPLLYLPLHQTKDLVACATLATTCMNARCALVTLYCLSAIGPLPRFPGHPSKIACSYHQWYTIDTHGTVMEAGAQMFRLGFLNNT